MNWDVETKVIIHKFHGEQFFLEQIEIWAGLEPVGNTEKKIGPIITNFCRQFFSFFHGQKKMCVF